MRIPGIDPPKIVLRHRHVEPSDWWKTTLELSGKDTPGRVYVCESRIVGPWVPPEITNKIYAVSLPWCLNWYDTLEEKLRVVREALEFVDDGGMVIAVARACDSGQELAERMVAGGVPLNELGVSNLSSRDIVALRPSQACFLAGQSLFSVSKELDKNLPRFLSFARNVRRSRVEPDIRFKPQQLCTRLLSVGLIWRKQDQPK